MKPKTLVGAVLLLLAFVVGGPVASGAGTPFLFSLTVEDLTTGKPITSGLTVSAGDEFQVTVTTTNSVDCAGQWAVTALGAPGNAPSVLVQTVPFTIGPAVGSNSATGGILTAGTLANGTNDFKISANCNGAVPFGQSGNSSFEFFVGKPGGQGPQPILSFTVEDLTTGKPITAGLMVSAGEFQVKVTTTNGVNCAGQWAVTKLGAPGNVPSVLVQTVPFIIGPAVGSNSAKGEIITVGGSNDFKVSASCNAAPPGGFGFSTFEFYTGAVVGVKNEVKLSSVNVENTNLATGDPLVCELASAHYNCFSIQQNFWITTSSNINYPTYLAQNAVELEKTGNGWQARQIYVLWNTPNGAFDTIAECSGVIDRRDPKRQTCSWAPPWEPFSLQSPILLTSTITTGAMVFDTLHVTSQLGDKTPVTFSHYQLPLGSFITAALTAGQVPGVNGLPFQYEPEFVMVGEVSAVDGSYIAKAKFTSPTAGLVTSWLQLPGQGWAYPGTETAASTPQFCVSAVESAAGLSWLVNVNLGRAAFTAVNNGLQEGVIFVPATGASGLNSCAQ